MIAGRLCAQKKDNSPGITYIEGDLLDPASLSKAVGGVAAIIHLTAVFRTPDTDLIWKSNLEGTRNLIAAVKANAAEQAYNPIGTAHGGYTSTLLVMDRAKRPRPSPAFSDNP